MEIPIRARDDIPNTFNIFYADIYPILVLWKITLTVYVIVLFDGIRSVTQCLCVQR